MPGPLKLSDHTINALNETIGHFQRAEAHERKGAISPASVVATAASWFANFGLGLSMYLPYLYRTWEALAAKGVSGVPSVQVFAAEFNLIVNGTAVDQAPAPAAK
jgi:hypothetical protein